MSTRNDSSVWNKIFTKYGTHFVYKTIVGARVSYQYEISFQDYLELKSLNVDLKHASSYKIIDSSSWTFNERQNIKLFKNNANEYNSVYIGGKTPENNEFYEWSLNVRENPKAIFIMALRNFHFYFQKKTFLH